MSSKPKLIRCAGLRSGTEWQEFCRRGLKPHNIPHAPDIVYAEWRRISDWLGIPPKKRLTQSHPDLAKEWHSTKNRTLTPNDVTFGSNKKVWWECKKEHEWQAQISDRSQSKGCPYCSNKKVCQDNCLAHINPRLAKEWHPIKNGTLTPNDVLAGSHQKVWWQCEMGHEWETTLAHRSRNGCPICGNKKAHEDNCLSATHPHLAGQWHPTKNGSLTPNSVTSGSDKKIWWRCPQKHEWKAEVYSRKINGCPYCANKKVCKDNCLSAIHPHLAKEWHPTKNGTLTPNDVLAGSHQKVWWKCEKGHKWEASMHNRTSIHNRTRRRGCPYCYNSRSA